ncbi:unnamed protein product [Cylindrotheca closterium]|uniref:Aminotransferase class V domain-containing protein n=1 Tax=Cylindrotheca closterium TaxID=2856 RepID=A0AAD2FSZ6_9STRA|nr:unnamed protein product [Cylindrotheca closterium]
MAAKLSSLLFFTGGAAATTVVAATGLYLTRRKSNDEGEEEEEEECIYLDYNGTTPIYKEVLEAMMPYLTTHFGNPSSSHKFGQAPRNAIELARTQILQLLGSTEPSNSIWFTGCGTESDNLAIQLALQSSSHTKNKHIVSSNVEHPAVDLYLKYLEKEGIASVTYVPVANDGRVNPQDMVDALQENTILVTLMLANNESGALQPIKAVAQECRKRGILMHTDAAQAAGKVSCELADLGFPDMITIVGHKLGAPKGIAALYVRPGCLEEHKRTIRHIDHGIMLIGGGQEFGRRGGTENTPYMVGLGFASQHAHQHLAHNAAHMEAMRSRLLRNLTERLGTGDRLLVNGPKNAHWRLPNTLSIGFKNVHSGILLAGIGNLVAASAGAACHSSGGGVSSILTAMQIPMEYAQGTLRLSLGPNTRASEIDKASRIIADAVEQQWNK